MKLITWILGIIYAVVYAYSVWMTYLHPELVVWGWICTYIFGMSSIWAVSKLTKNDKSM